MDFDPAQVNVATTYYSQDQPGKPLPSESSSRHLLHGR
jgi:hypothetical protein